MSNSVQAIPAGHEGMIPHLVCDDAAAAIEFYKKAFGAEEVYRMPAPDGQRIMHASIRIGKDHVFLADDFPEFCGGQGGSAKALGASPVTVHKYVENVDAVVQRALDAGATAMMPVGDAFWGDRYGAIIDPFGHRWSFATHIKDLTPEEIKAAMDEAFSQMPMPG